MLPRFQHVLFLDLLANIDVLFILDNFFSSSKNTHAENSDLYKYEIFILKNSLIYSDIYIKNNHFVEIFFVIKKLKSVP